MEVFLKKSIHFLGFEMEYADFNTAIILKVILINFSQHAVLPVDSRPWRYVWPLSLSQVASCCCAFGVPGSTFYQGACHFTPRPNFFLARSRLRNQICQVVKILCKQKVNRIWVRNLASSIPIGFIQSFLEGNSSSSSLGTVALNYVLL